MTGARNLADIFRDINMNTATYRKVIECIEKDKDFPLSLKMPINKENAEMYSATMVKYMKGDKKYKEFHPALLEALGGKVKAAF